MNFNKVLMGFVAVLSIVVLCELSYLYALNNTKSNDVKKPNILKQIQPTDVKKKIVEKGQNICQTEESRSCANWFARYKHILSTETVTKGTFNGFEESEISQETRIKLSSLTEQYYVSYMRDVTKLKLLDSSNKEINRASLKKGDFLSIVEKYQKKPDNSEEFSVTIVREKP